MFIVKRMDIMKINGKKKFLRTSLIKKSINMAAFFYKQTMLKRTF